MWEHPFQFPLATLTAISGWGDRLWQELIGIVGWQDILLQPWVYFVLTIFLLLVPLQRLQLDNATRVRVTVISGLVVLGYVTLVYLIFFLTVASPLFSCIVGFPSVLKAVTLSFHYGADRAISLALLPCRLGRGRRPSRQPSRNNKAMITGTFLRNAWYVAMWSEDVTAGQVVSRTILNETIAIFRKADGSVAALTDRCAHRFAPLHLGKVVAGDRIQCAYHGLEFDGSGACVLNPHGNGRIAPRALV